MSVSLRATEAAHTAEKAAGGDSLAAMRVLEAAAQGQPEWQIAVASRTLLHVVEELVVRVEPEVPGTPFAAVFAASGVGGEEGELDAELSLCRVKKMA